MGLPSFGPNPARPRILNISKPKAASLVMRNKGLGIFSPSIERKPMSLVCIDSEMAHELKSSRAEIVELRQQMKALEEEGRRDQASSPRGPWQALEEVEKDINQVELQKLKDRVRLLQHQNSELQGQVTDSRMQEAALTAQILHLQQRQQEQHQQHTAAAEAWIAERAQLLEQTVRLQELNAKIQVYCKDSTMLKALREAERRLLHTEQCNAQLAALCKAHHLPVPMLHAAASGAESDDECSTVEALPFTAESSALSMGVLRKACHRSRCGATGPSSAIASRDLALQPWQVGIPKDLGPVARLRVSRSKAHHSATIHRPPAATPPPRPQTSPSVGNGGLPGLSA